MQNRSDDKAFKILLSFRIFTQGNVSLRTSTVLYTSIQDIHGPVITGLSFKCFLQSQTYFSYYFIFMEFNFCTAQVTKAEFHLKFNKETVPREPIRWRVQTKITRKSIPSKSYIRGSETKHVPRKVAVFINQVISSQRIQGHIC